MTWITFLAAAMIATGLLLAALIAITVWAQESGHRPVRGPDRLERAKRTGIDPRGRSL